MVKKKVKGKSTSIKKSNIFSNSRKPVIIIIIVLVSLSLLTSLIFFSDVFVGQAIQTLPLGTFNVNEGGAVSTLNLPANSNEIITLNVGTNIGTSESVGFKFLLNYPSDILEFVSVDPKLNWGNDFLRVTSDQTVGTIQFEYATIDFTKAITGSLLLADVNFRVKSGQTLDTNNILNSDGSGKINFASLTILDLAEPHNNLITNIMNPIGEVSCVQTTCPSFTNQDGLSWFDTYAKKEELCGQYNIVTNTCEDHNLWFDGLSSIEKDALCGFNQNVCTPSGTFNADLNSDGKVNDGDIVIIQLAMLSAESSNTDCGADNQDACSFPGIFVCENLKNSYTTSFSCGGVN